MTARTRQLHANQEKQVFPYAALRLTILYMVFRSLVRNWLQNAARQKLREKAVEAAREEFAKQPAAPERPCDVGIVFALGIEAGGMEDLLDSALTTRAHGFVVRQGDLGGRHVVLVQSGTGGHRAARATEALIQGHRPAWVISAGFAGGLDARLRRHDILMADSLVNTEEVRLAIDLKVDPENLSGTPGVHVGRLLSTDQVVRAPDEKRSLGEKYQALAVDLESFSAAQVCRDRQTRFLAIRIITDTVDEELLPEVRRLSRQKTHLRRLGSAVGTIWNRPSSLKDMFQLKENALVGSDRLAKFLTGIVDQLAQPPLLS